MVPIPTFKLRNFILTETDWTQVSDNSLTQEERDAWKVFRQAVRDINTENFRPEWPTPPSTIQCRENIPEQLLLSNIGNYFL
jgi:hypothetical protein